jgi:two-component system nitrate/nitrite response regulator NarL
VTATGTLRTIVVADDLLARAGLAALLAAEPGCSIVGQTPADDDLAAVLDAAAADAVVWDLGRDPADALARLAALDHAAPVLALLADGEAAADALAAGAHGAVPRGAPPKIVVAAARAIADGLIAIHPSCGGLIPAKPGESPPMAEPLSEREAEVLSLVAEGLANKEIAARLGISEHTVRFHVRALLGKLGTQNRTEAVVRALRLGLITL